MHVCMYVSMYFDLCKDPILSKRKTMEETYDPDVADEVNMHTHSLNGAGTDHMTV